MSSVLIAVGVSGVAELKALRKGFYGIFWATIRHGGDGQTAKVDC